MLSLALGESEAVWRMRLANGRRPTRQSPIPWEETEAGNAVYKFDDVQAFIDRELGRRAATSPPLSGELTTKATAVADIESERPFVRLLWNAGASQGAVSLSPSVAKELAQKLLQATVAVQGRGRA
jgi:hypothetical protein